jgi:hypothetical protein
MQVLVSKHLLIGATNVKIKSDNQLLEADEELANF